MFSRNATSTTKCRTPLCFFRFYPAYFRYRYRSRTGNVSENYIGCGFLDWKLGVDFCRRSEISATVSGDVIDWGRGCWFVVAPPSSATGLYQFIDWGRGR